MKWSLIDAKKGDMIRVKNGSIFHYGIYVSDEEVIQFGYPPMLRDKDRDNIVVVTTDIDTFACSNFVEVGEYERKDKSKAYPVEKIVENARSRIGEGGYNILHNNCEHFVYECVFGIKYCSQEEDVRNQMRAMLEKGKK